MTHLTPPTPATAETEIQMYLSWARANPDLLNQTLREFYQLHPSEEWTTSAIITEHRFYLRAVRKRNIWR